MIFVSTYHSLWHLGSFWETRLRFGCFSPRADVIQQSGLAFLSTGFIAFYTPDVQQPLDSACILPIALGPQLAFPCVFTNVHSLSLGLVLQPSGLTCKSLQDLSPQGCPIWLYSLSCWFSSPSSVSAPLATNPGPWNENLLRLTE